MEKQQPYFISADPARTADRSVVMVLDSHGDLVESTIVDEARHHGFGSEVARAANGLRFLPTNFATQAFPGVGHLMSHRVLAQKLDVDQRTVLRHVLQLAGKHGCAPCVIDRAETGKRGRPMITHFVSQDTALRVAALVRSKVPGVLSSIAHAFREHASTEAAIATARLELQTSTIERLSKRTHTLQRAARAANDQVIELTRQLNNLRPRALTLPVRKTFKFALPAWFSYRCRQRYYIPSDRHQDGMRLLIRIGIVDSAGEPTELGAQYAQRRGDKWTFDQALVQVIMEELEAAA